VNELLLPNPLYLFAVLAALCVYAFRHRGTRLGRWRWLLLAVLVWCYLFSTPGFANAIVARVEWPEVDAAAVPPSSRPPLIMVLSSGAVVRHAGRDEVRLDGAAWARTWAGIRLWRQRGGELLFVGGPISDGTSSLAEAMAAVAREAGVPAAVVRVETRSRNTHENLAFNQSLIAAHGGPLWIVTSAVHMRRALATARKLGLEAQPYPCDRRAVELKHVYAWVPSGGGPTMLSEVMHELVGRIYYRLRGWAA
jgi:uncharacterized SAM-binding protein YcdF (DUF218 family)